MSGKGKGGRLSLVNSTTPAKVEKVFKLKDVVFAKIRGYPAWPARVEEVIEPANQPKRYFVFFYGTHQTGTCKAEELQLFGEISGALKASCKRKRILEAIREAEENPDVEFEQNNSPQKKVVGGKKKPGTQEEKNDVEKDDAEKEEDSLEEKEEEVVEAVKAPQRKSKTPKAVVQKRPAKSMKLEEYEDEGQLSDEAPVKKKRKIRKSLKTPKFSNPDLKNRWTDASSDEESLLSKEEVPAPKVIEAAVEPKEEDFTDSLFIQFQEAEDENMPVDERIVRRLIKSAVWECIDDNLALETVTRRMRRYFEDDKIKNWDTDELFESIDMERRRSKEKIEECVVLENWGLNEFHKQLLEEDNKAKMKAEAASNDSDEDDDIDDEKNDGYFVKYYTRHQLELMKNMQNLRCSPDYYTFVVHLAFKNGENEPEGKVQPLTPLEQHELYREEEKFVLLANELPAMLPLTGRSDTKAAIELLKLLNSLKLTLVMLCKNISCVQNIYRLTKYDINKGTADSDEPNEARKEDNGHIKQLAIQLIKKFTDLVLPEDILKNSPLSPTKKAEELVNGDLPTENMSNDSSNWMLYDILKTKHSILLKAAEGNKEEFIKILQEPVALKMTKIEYSQLKTLLLTHKTGFSKDKEAAMKITALVRSYDLGAGLETIELPSILFRNGKSTIPQKN